jgi:integrase
MAGKVLTATLIDSLDPPTVGRLEIADLRCSGLSFRITKAGARSWCFRFRDPENGKTTRATIGAYPAVSLKAARERADKMRKQVAAGVNPTKHKRAAVAGAGARTFKALADRYMTEHAERHKRPASVAGDRANLDLHILPKWKDRAYASIRRADAIELIEGLISDDKPTLANRVHSLISMIFSFAVDAGLMEANPFLRMKKRGAENVGDRVLTDGELRIFWNGIAEPAAEEADEAPALQSGLALRLALLTGTRRGEVAGICRSELADLDNAVGALWTIPGARTKNGRDHAIPLAPRDPAEQFLLPTLSTKHNGHMRPESLTRAMSRFGERITVPDENSEHIPDENMRAAMAAWKAKPPSPHDLRRTLETRLAALGIAKDIRDRCLNHVSGDVDRHSYLPEKRAAFTRWNDALGSILEMPTDTPAAQRRAAGLQRRLQSRGAPISRGGHPRRGAV